MQKTIVLAPDQAIVLARRPHLASRFLAGATLLALTGINAMAQGTGGATGDAAEMVTAATAKMTEFQGYAILLGTGALGVVALIAVFQLGRKFLKG